MANSPCSMQAKFKVFWGFGGGQWLELVETNTNTDNITVGSDQVFKCLGTKALLR